MQLFCRNRRQIANKTIFFVAIPDNRFFVIKYNLGTMAGVIPLGILVGSQFFFYLSIFGDRFDSFVDRPTLGSISVVGVGGDMHRH